MTETLSVPYGPDRYSAMKHDFLLRRVPATAGGVPLRPTSANLTPPCNNTLRLDGGGANTGPSWAGLSAGLAMVAALRSLIG